MKLDKELFEKTRRDINVTMNSMWLSMFEDETGEVCLSDVEHWMYMLRAELQKLEEIIK